MATPYDVVIVGGGGAGLRAAIAINEVNSRLSAAIISKVYPMRSHTVCAEGGTAGAISVDDNFDEHAHDTVAGGDWLCDQELTHQQLWFSSRRPPGFINRRFAVRWPLARGSADRYAHLSPYVLRAAISPRVRVEYHRAPFVVVAAAESPPRGWSHALHDFRSVHKYSQSSIGVGRIHP